MTRHRIDAAAGERYGELVALLVLAGRGAASLGLLYRLHEIVQDPGAEVAGVPRRTAAGVARLIARALITDQSGAVRYGAARLLGEIGTADDVPRLAAMLGSERDWELRAHAATALGERGARALEPLAAAYAEERNPMARIAIAQAAAWTGDPRAGAMLDRWASDRDEPEWRALLLSALFASGESSRVDEMLTLVPRFRMSLRTAGGRLSQVLTVLLNSLAVAAERNRRLSRNQIRSLEHHAAALSRVYPDGPQWREAIAALTRRVPEYQPRRTLARSVAPAPALAPLFDLVVASSSSDSRKRGDSASTLAAAVDEPKGRLPFGRRSILKAVARLVGRAGVTDPDDMARYDAVELLGMVATRADARRFRAALSDVEWIIRAEAAETLGYLGRAQFGALARAYAEEPEWAARYYMAGAAAATGHPRALAALSEWADAAGVEERAYLLAVLAEEGDASRVDEIAALLPRFGIGNGKHGEPADTFFDWVARSLARAVERGRLQPDNRLVDALEHYIDVQARVFGRIGPHMDIDPSIRTIRIAAGRVS